MTERKLRILLLASEVEGLVKTGGLADVCYALPKALAAMGHDVRILMPAYQVISDIWQQWPQRSFSTKLSYYLTENVTAYYGEHESLKVIAINHPHSFDREGIYGQNNQSYDDNALRYAIFSKSALDWCKLEYWQPDIVHANDWQTGIAGFYLAEHHASDDFFKATRSVLSLHNAAYQEHVSAKWLTTIGVHERFFNPTDFEDNGHINLLKGSIGFADGVCTVSPGYASELISDNGGHGLNFKFKSLSRPIKGILNGCDYDQWSPETDSWLAETYSTPQDPGKAHCKKALQKELSLPCSSEKPLIGTICRLAEQKGIQLLVPVLWEIMRDDDCQVVILGSGDQNLANQLNRIEQHYPDRFRFIEGYDVGLSHRIEAGLDAFLMPSIFEPCGLNQIYSLRYGTLPLVRSVGGLKDTVNRLTETQRNTKTATGFMFEDETERALHLEIVRMLSIYRTKPELWKQMQGNAMSQRFNWKESASSYEKLYRSLLKAPKLVHPLLSNNL